MDMATVLRKKAHRGTLEDAHIGYFIDALVKNEIDVAQSAALLAFMYANGLDKEETRALTMHMARSGRMLDLSDIRGETVDKHSTGGVGDKTTLIVGPLAAACGLMVPKMSGRGLGHTGGTIDKLESIPSMNTNLSIDQFKTIVSDIGFAVTAQTEDIAPADKTLYSIRDLTGTVDSIPLIAASIMSKKIASGANHIVLDVKTGSGAFMKDKAHAEKLAKLLIDLGRHAGCNTVCVLSDMNEPLGMMVGNALEVKEAIQTMQGNGPDDLIELCTGLCAVMCCAAGLYESHDLALQIAREKLDDGSALSVFERFIKAQGADASVIEDQEKLRCAPPVFRVQADRSGFISSMDCEAIGQAVMMLGAGRKKINDSIDHGAGIQMLCKTGDRVEKNQPMVVLHANQESATQPAAQSIAKAITIDESAKKRERVLLDIIK